MSNILVQIVVNLDVEGTIRAFEFNWKVNRAFQKVRGEIEKRVKVQDSKV
jgi:hypothetical protein